MVNAIEIIVILFMVFSFQMLLPDTGISFLFFHCSHSLSPLPLDKLKTLPNQAVFIQRMIVYTQSVNRLDPGGLILLLFSRAGVCLYSNVVTAGFFSVLAVFSTVMFLCLETSPLQA